MGVWIYFNERATELKPPVLTSYLRTIFKNQKARKTLKREDLVEGTQKMDTLSKHLKMAQEAGLLEIRHSKYEINGEWRSNPNVYIICNPTLKIQCNDASELSEAIAYSIQKQLGKKHSPYLTQKYEQAYIPTVILEPLAKEDWADNKFREDLTALGITVSTYSK